MQIEKRPGACMIIYNSDSGYVYMGQRSDTQKWCFAGGKQEKSDQNDSLKTALRELKEEFGIILEPSEKIHYLGDCVVPGFKRIKHENAEDTFKPTWYNTSVYLVVTTKNFKYIPTDGEMNKIIKVNLDDIFTQLGDKLSSSTVIVANLAVCFIKNFIDKERTN